MDSYLGVDFGTVNIVVVYSRNGVLTLLDFESGSKCLKTVVGVGKSLIFGNNAYCVYSNSVLSYMKLLIGRNLNDLRINKLSIDKFGVKLVDGEKEVSVSVTTGDGNTYQYSISTIVKELFIFIRQEAQKRIGQKITKVVVSVPACFNTKQRSILVDAVKEAGLEEVRILSEPTASALSYIKDHNILSEKTILVYDFGGTFAVNVVKVRDGNSLTILATSGDFNIGGDNFDHLLASLIIKKFKAKYKEVKFKSLDQTRFYHRFLNNVKLIKESDGGEISLDDIIDDDSDDSEDDDTVVYDSISITRDNIKSIVKSKVDETLSITKATLLLAFPGIDISEALNRVDIVLPVGGSSSLAYVHESLKTVFGERVVDVPNPKVICALGCAELARGADVTEVNEVTVYDYGFRCSKDHFAVLIPKGTPLPLDHPYRMQFSTKSPQQEVVTTYIYEGDSTKSQVVTEMKRSDPITFHVPKRRRNRISVFTMEMMIDINGSFSIRVLSYPKNELIKEFKLWMKHCYVC